MRRFNMVLSMAIFAILAAVSAARAQQPAPAARPNAGPLPTIAEKTQGMKKYDGYFPFYWDAKAGKIWLEIDKWNTEFLYVHDLPAGVGSNDIGLDRGQLGGESVVRFERIGPKVLMVESNYSYRAVNGDPGEQKAVRESFAESALWGFEVAAEDSDRVLVDASGFFLRDAHDIPATLRRTHQGAYRLDPARCAFYLDNTKNFPKNTEVEATLTFAGDEPGNWVRQVTPEPESITVREHHSFVELPPPGFKPRVYDPRSSFFAIEYMDYATPIAEPVMKRFIARHRLEKKDPNAAVSEPVRPIVYYLDRGTPEPIRSALLEGARWWAQAFEAAGFKDAFKVEVMPPDADPMDVRYNVIMWVHRSTRGWSNGASVVDPRTGEIIQGRVTLGSLRVRQDYLIAEGLLAPYEKGKPLPAALLQSVLARLRQLAAHEVGHTLGLQHNFASSMNNRASVMDYPPPLVKLGADGVPDLSDAYATGIGTWDKVSIAYGYSQFAPGAGEHAALSKILDDAAARGLRYLTDQDARPPGASSPVAHLWDTGSNAVDELNRLMGVRKAALARFGENNIREGAPMTTLQEVLVPLYLLHRYQVEAAAKVVGGMDYTFAVRGGYEKPTTMVAPGEQRRALDSVLATLKPDALALPESLLRMIPPRAPQYPMTRELFRPHTSPTFDALSPAEADANITLAFLFNAERGARLIEFHARDAQYPGFDEVLDKTLAATWHDAHDAGYAGAIQRTVANVALYDLMQLAVDPQSSDQVRGMASLKLDELKNWLSQQLASAQDESWRAHYFFALNQITRFETDPKQMNFTPPMDPPDGQPIGSDVFMPDLWDFDGGN